MEPDKVKAKDSESGKDLLTLIGRIEEADTVEMCVSNLQACFDYFNLGEYVLFPKNRQFLPTVNSKTPVAIETEARLLTQERQTGQSPFSPEGESPFPFKATGLQAADPEPMASPALDGLQVLPVHGESEKAHLVICKPVEDLPEERLLAVQAICANSIHQIERINRRNSAKSSSLSDLEESLLDSIAKGRNQDEIAREFGLSPNTISLASNNISKRLGADTIRQAASMRGGNAPQ